MRVLRRYYLTQIPQREVDHPPAALSTQTPRVVMISHENRVIGLQSLEMVVLMHMCDKSLRRHAAYLTRTRMTEGEGAVIR